MTVAQKFRPFQSTVFAVSQPAVPQDTTHFTPKVGYEVMTHGYFKWNIVCSPLQHGFLVWLIKRRERCVFVLMATRKMMTDATSFPLNEIVEKVK